MFIHNAEWENAPENIVWCFYCLINSGRCSRSDWDGVNFHHSSLWDTEFWIWVYNTAGSTPVFWPLLGSVKVSFFPHSVPSVSWGGRAHGHTAGQLTQTGQRNIPYNVRNHRRVFCTQGSCCVRVAGHQFPRGGGLSWVIAFALLPALPAPFLSLTKPPFSQPTSFLFFALNILFPVLLEPGISLAMLQNFSGMYWFHWKM